MPSFSSFLTFTRSLQFLPSPDDDEQPPMPGAAASDDGTFLSLSSIWEDGTLGCVASFVAPRQKTSGPHVGSRRTDVTTACTTMELFPENSHCTIINALERRDFRKNMITGAFHPDIPVDGNLTIATAKGNRQTGEFLGLTRTALTDDPSPQSQASTCDFFLLRADP